MKLILFGATGMVGQGVLREALAEPDVEVVLCVGRRSCGVSHPKLREVLIADLFAGVWLREVAVPDPVSVRVQGDGPELQRGQAQFPVGPLQPELQEGQVQFRQTAPEVSQTLHGFDACIWALGVSSVGLTEAGYSRVTVELTLLWAKALLALNPGLSFCYCSGMGADGGAMWARVRRRVEGALKELPFRHVGVVRPGLIRPMHGISHRYLSYRIFLALMWPVFPLLVWLFPGLCTTTARLGRAMLRVVAGRADTYILESRDINRVGR